MLGPFGGVVWLLVCRVVIPTRLPHVVVFCVQFFLDLSGPLFELLFRCISGDLAEYLYAVKIRSGIVVLVIEEVAALIAIHFACAGAHERKKQWQGSLPSFFLYCDPRRSMTAGPGAYDSR